MTEIIKLEAIYVGSKVGIKEPQLKYYGGENPPSFDETFKADLEKVITTSDGKRYQLNVTMVNSNDLYEHIGYSKANIENSLKLPDLIIARPGKTLDTIFLLQDIIGKKDATTGKGVGILFYTSEEPRSIEEFLQDKGIKGCSVMYDLNMDKSHIFADKIGEAMENISQQGSGLDTKIKQEPVKKKSTGFLGNWFVRKGNNPGESQAPGRQ